MQALPFVFFIFQLLFCTNFLTLSSSMVSVQISGEFRGIEFQNYFLLCSDISYSFEAKLNFPINIWMVLAIFYSQIVGLAFERCIMLSFSKKIFQNFKFCKKKIAKWCLLPNTNSNSNLVESAFTSTIYFCCIRKKLSTKYFINSFLELFYINLHLISSTS